MLNDKKLGERKNGNLPGVKARRPSAQGRRRHQKLACKNKMDYIAVSFVQTAEDVQLVRSILDENGGEDIRSSRRLNEEGMRNFDDILKYTDGDGGARRPRHGDPLQKVALAQKMMITKCNIAGKFVICATQMLESCARTSPHSRGDDGRGERGV